MNKNRELGHSTNLLLSTWEAEIYTSKVFHPSSQLYSLLLYIQAHEKGWRYPLFTFLHPAWWVGNWWVGNDTTESYDCTVKEREAVVHRSIAVLLYEYYETLDDVAETGTVSNILCNVL